MDFTLNLTVDQNKIWGLLGIEDIVTARANQAMDSSLVATTEQIIGQLLSKSAIQPEQITQIFITADFLDLFNGGYLPCPVIGYVRYLPRITNNQEPLYKSPLRHQVVTETVDSEDGLSQALFNLKANHPAALAVNPSFFSWGDLTEGALSALTRRILGYPLPVMLGSVFNKIGFIARENILLVNTLLLPGVQSFYDQLHAVLARQNIQAKIWTLRNNGMLMTETRARQFPIYTTNSHLAAHLLAAGRPLALDNMLVISARDNNLLFGILEQGLPLCSQVPLEYKGIALNLTHPFIKTIPLDRYQSIGDLKRVVKETLHTLHHAGESRPVVINLADPAINNLLLHTCQSLNLPVQEAKFSSSFGARYAPICVEQEHYLPAYTSKKRAEIQDLLWGKLKEELRAEGLSIKEDWQSYWEERPIRYLPEQASLIRLGYYGPKS